MGEVTASLSPMWKLLPAKETLLLLNTSAIGFSTPPPLPPTTTTFTIRTPSQPLLLERRGEMGRGKIEIKMIENPTNRQVTYSKRRGGIKKKAEELTVLCDAQVCLVMISNTNKLFEYCSPSTDVKTIVDRYQQTTGIDVWKPQYEMMQKKLSHLKDVNSKLRKEIRQRMGEELEGCDFKDLRGLEQEMDSSLKGVRDRKYHVISTQTETYKKKLRNSEEAHRKLLQDLVEMEGPEVLDYAFMDQHQAEYEAAALGLANRAALAFRVQPSQPNLHDMGYGFHELRLA